MRVQRGRFGVLGHLTSTAALEESVAQLNAMELTRFIRVKEQVDKEAILKEPDAVKDIKGIKVGSAGEKFIVKPFETQLEEVA